MADPENEQDFDAVTDYETRAREFLAKRRQYLAAGDLHQAEVRPSPVRNYRGGDAHGDPGKPVAGAMRQSPPDHLESGAAIQPTGSPSS